MSGQAPKICVRLLNFFPLSFPPFTSSSLPPLLFTSAFRSASESGRTHLTKNACVNNASNASNAVLRVVLPFPHPPVPCRRGCQYMSVSGRIRACPQYRHHSRYKLPYSSKRLFPSVQMYSTHIQNHLSLGAQAGFQVHSLQGRLAPHHSSHHLQRTFPSSLR